MRESHDQFARKLCKNLSPSLVELNLILNMLVPSHIIVTVSRKLYGSIPMTVNAFWTFITWCI